MAHRLTAALSPNLAALVLCQRSGLSVTLQVRMVCSGSPLDKCGRHSGCLSLGLSGCSGSRMVSGGSLLDGCSRSQTGRSCALHALALVCLSRFGWLALAHRLTNVEARTAWLVCSRHGSHQRSISCHFTSPMHLLHMAALFFILRAIINFKRAL